ncbi:MAG: acetyl-CoA carboxylase carboxyltransferase subunit alpha [Chthonomonadaceae bacterium]|nr:acetyl-CoA carboxylase carboxyltransferase subunit alpha [Chthonomonadaceae bacterium]
MKNLLELEDLVGQIKTQLVQESDPIRYAELDAKVKSFEDRRDKILELMFSRLGPWEETLLARADPRPYTLDYVQNVFSDFLEIEGDRRFGADHAIVCGPAILEGRPVMVVGHQKGRNIQERTYRNFAMAKPEGYRKAVRMFQMAERFQMPVVTFVDTPAADPGVESESRGISEAIAASMLAMFELTVPVVSIVIGEGGSGGAIGIAAANIVLMQEHAVYSVIPPEGCAAILWRDPAKGPQAAAALRLTSKSALEFGLVDGIVKEPFGSAYRDPITAATLVKEAIIESLAKLDSIGLNLKSHRYERFRRAGSSYMKS